MGPAPDGLRRGRPRSNPAAPRARIHRHDSTDSPAMRYARTLPIAALAVLAACAPQPPAAVPSPSPDNAEATLVAAERAFEAATIREGVRDAFIRFADDSAIIFRPEPINAPQSFRSRPATRIGLRWHPAVVRAARSGDLGFTSGPSQVLDSAGTVIGYGNYATVWRRNADGWKYVVDLGIETPQPGQVPVQWTPRASAMPRVGSGNAAATAALLAADGEFDARAASNGFASAVEAFGDREMWLLRNRALPHVGLQAALAAAVADSARRYSATPSRAFASEAGDFGWTWGEYRYVHEGAGRRETGHYVRVWARDGSRWRLLLDVTSPRPSDRDE